MSESEPLGKEGEEIDLAALAAEQRQYAQGLENERQEGELAAQKELEKSQLLKDYAALTAQRAAIGTELRDAGVDPDSYGRMTAELDKMEAQQSELLGRMAEVSARLAANAATIKGIEAIIAGQEKVAPAVAEAMEKARTSSMEAQREMAGLHLNYTDIDGVLTQKTEDSGEWLAIMDKLEQADSDISALYENGAVRDAVFDEATFENEVRERVVNQAAAMLEGTGNYGSRRLGENRAAFLKEALQIFLTEDMEAAELTSLAEYDTEGLLMGLREGGGYRSAHEKDTVHMAHGPQHAEAMNKGVFLRGILDSNPSFGLDATSKRLAFLGEPQRNNSVQTQFGTKERNSIISHLRFLNFVKAAVEGSSLNLGIRDKRFYKTVFDDRATTMTESWNSLSGYNPLSSMAFATQEGRPVYPSEWRQDEAGRKKIESITSVYTQRYQKSQAESKDMRKAEYENCRARKDELEAYFVAYDQRQQEANKGREILDYETNIIANRGVNERAATRVKQEIRQIEADLLTLGDEKVGLLNVARRRQQAREIAELELSLDGKKSYLAQCEASLKEADSQLASIKKTRQYNDEVSKNVDLYMDLKREYRQIEQRLQIDYEELKGV